MATYIKIKDCENGNPLIVPLDEAKDILTQEVENFEYSGEANAYSFEPVDMSEEEFKSLPEFQGF